MISGSALQIKELNPDSCNTPLTKTKVKPSDNLSKIYPG